MTGYPISFSSAIRLGYTDFVKQASLYSVDLNDPKTADFLVDSEGGDETAPEPPQL
jgi:hypothetical protein